MVRLRSVSGRSAQSMGSRSIKLRRTVPSTIVLAGSGFTRELLPLMIICSCNVLSDHDVRSAVTAGAEIPRTAGQVYGCLGCSAQCGRCARTIKQIMSEALGPCAKACCDGCPHSHDKHDAAQPAQHKMPAVAANLDLQIAAA